MYVILDSHMTDAYYKLEQTKNRSLKSLKFLLINPKFNNHLFFI